MYCPSLTLLLVNGYLQHIHQTSKLKRLQQQLVLHFLALHLELDNIGHLSTKVNDNRDDFNINIITCLYLCCSIPSSPAYGVYISQLVHFTRASTN